MSLDCGAVGAKVDSDDGLWRGQAIERWHRKAQLPQATVYRSAVLPDGNQVVSHAKFIIIDHAMLLLTSANSSFSSENRNIGFGLRIHDPALAEFVETMMTSKHGSLYELA